MLVYLIVTAMDNFRKKLIVELSILGVVILLAAILLGILGRAITATADRGLALRRELTMKEAAIGSLAKLKADAVRAASLKPRLDALVPPKDWFINFSNDIAALGRANKVAARAALTGEAEETDTVPAGFWFEITASSEYDQLLAFLRALETHTPLMRFVNVDLVRGERANFDGNIKGRVFTQ